MLGFLAHLVWLFVWHVLLSPFRLWFLLSFGTYFVIEAIIAVWYKTQNLKKRYNAEWALVTGSSSGKTIMGRFCTICSSIFSDLMAGPL
jgi:hypothetical protein